MKRFVIAAYVENKYGVLTRVSGLFMRKGFNIDSLTVGAVEDTAYSRITLTMRGDDYQCGQLINQLKKLFNVKNVLLLEDEHSVERELMLIKLNNTPENESTLSSLAAQYGIRLTRSTETVLCTEVVGTPLEIDEFIEAVRPLGIIELCRTGVVALETNRNITDAKD